MTEGVKQCLYVSKTVKNTGLIRKLLLIIQGTVREDVFYDFLSPNR